MAMDRCMDTEIVVNICNGLLLSYKNVFIWVGPNEVDEPRAYYTEWSKSERERQILYVNTCIWNLERWYWWTYLQGKSGDADIEGRYTVWKGEGVMTWENSMERYTLCK